MWRRKFTDLFLGLVGILVVLFVVSMFYGTIEHMPLDRWVSPPSGIRAEDWNRDFDAVQWNYVFWPAATLALVWVIATSFLDSGVLRDLRWAWVSFDILGLVLAGYAIVMQLPLMSSGHLVAALVMVVNAVFAYWLMTIFTTPQSHKYAPLLAGSLRRW